MVGILLVTHGQMASGLLNATELIVGEQEAVATIELKEMDAIDALEASIDQEVLKLNSGDGVLVLVDLFGASPFNASARVAVRYPDVDVITGMNLPMLLETVMNKETSDLQSLIEIATNAGMGGVRVLKQLLNSQSE